MLILTHVVVFVAGFLIYHWILGRAGFFGRLAHNQVEKRLKKAGKKIIPDIREEPDPNEAGTRSNLKYGKYSRRKE